MKYLDKKDLEGVFLVILRMGKSDKAHLPFIRRHFRSVQNLCAKHKERQIDIYFSAVFVATKAAHAKRLSMNEDFVKSTGAQEVYEIL